MFNIRRNPQLRAMWWDADVELPSVTNRVSRNKAEKLSSDEELAKVPVHPRKSYLGRFNPSKKWKPYTHIGVDAGYICPLYSMKDIAYRYGLSQNTQRHWKKNVLPEPIDIVIRRGVRAHHWSRIQLAVLDDILIYLERHGHMRLTVKYDDVIDLFQYGCEVLEKYFNNKYETLPFGSFDRYGVSLHER